MKAGTLEIEIIAQIAQDAGGKGLKAVVNDLSPVPVRGVRQQAHRGLKLVFVLKEVAHGIHIFIVNSIYRFLIDVIHLPAGRAHDVSPRLHADRIDLE